MNLKTIALCTAALAMTAPIAAEAKPGKRHTVVKVHKKTMVRTAPTRWTSTERWNETACPPGLAKKYPSCVPPGQWKKGDSIPEGWGQYYTSYDRLPDYYRTRYPDNAGYRYLYNNDRVYVVNAATQALIDIFLR